MSFSNSTKAELCRDQLVRKCCALAESYGLLLYCNTFSAREIKIITENRELAQRLPKLLRHAFGLTFDILPTPDNELEAGAKAVKQTFIINRPEKLNAILDAFGFTGNRLLAHHINLGVLEDECCRASFLRGAFLAGGSVTDPAKRYHLELVTDHYNVSREMYSLLLDMGFEPKEAKRKGNFVNYFKQSSAIEDFLTTIGAPLSAMKLMSEKVEKDMRNTINRKVNCDTANVSKTVDAALLQIEAIGRIAAATGLDSLPDKLRETAFRRLENPEMSLNELADLMSVTKSCLNHRLRKLVELGAKAQ
ncbi:MAG: DNA-binding protein WhiA [Clostridiales bacterium]|jgi:DNA-binding protein WhiA|nr:DNA-binding protein WhiA [Clostridiales bacterium]